MKLGLLLKILYEQHQIIISEQRCKHILQYYSGRKTVSKMIKYIVKQYLKMHIEESEPSESIDQEHFSTQNLFDVFDQQDLLIDHNNKRTEMGLPIVENLPNDVKEIENFNQEYITYLLKH